MRIANVPSIAGRAFTVVWMTGVVAGCSQNATGRIKDIERALEAAVPVGTPHQRVQAILDSQKIEHSALDAQSGTITAIVRDVSATATTSTSLQMVLKFDAKGNLATIDFKPVRTGP
jgi:hypothetical protein